MDTPEITYDLNSAKKTFSRIGFALIAFYLATLISQSLLIAALASAFPAVFEGEISSVIWIAFSSATMYLVGFPVFYLIIRKLPTDAPRKSKCPLSTFFVSLLIMVALMYLGQNIGSYLYLALSEWMNIDFSSETLTLVSDIKWYEAFIFTVVIAPFVEEMAFRKLIIDRTRVYGEKFAVIFSALLFALFHMSVEQFFYAFFIGLLFGYFYIRKGSFWLCWLLHAVFNFIGGVLPLIVNSLVDMEEFVAVMLEEDIEKLIKLVEENSFGYGMVSLYSFALLGLSFAGFICLIIRFKKLRFKKTALELPKDSEATVGFLNAGVILFTLFTIVYPLVSAALS